MTKFNRRTFCRTASIGALAAGGTAASTVKIAADEKSASKDETGDPSVKKRTGPFGEGLPITMAGYAYNRARAIVEGSVTIEGCAHQFEVTSIGPMNNHRFLWSPDPAR